ncbi:DUF3718 domain-containing protein [Colwellia sp. E2M01]|uniref:DUF3718 domain-containing protein n=1 Tax=Colwellia sp. E2M01 TaxID=2841561 RepID=UPI001C0829E6|nr:DUF3718 domain-containing protein [Colwellia sp. E2M01]MBU2869180.1 DUF3718 domain-containing protein [Colwellia sp. E2M01]
MKRVLIVSTICVLIFTSSMTVFEVKAADLGTSICEYVASDNKKRLRSFLKQNKLKIRHIFSELRCNAQNILEFSATSGSLNIGQLIISKLPKDVVAENLPTLEKTSKPLFDAANERIN